MEDCVQLGVHTLEKHLSTLNKKVLKEVSPSRIIENNKYGKSTKEIRHRRIIEKKKKKKKKKEIHKEHQEKYEGEAKDHGIG